MLQVDNATCWRVNGVNVYLPHTRRSVRGSTKSNIVESRRRSRTRYGGSTSKGQGPSAILLHFEDVHVPRCRLLAMTTFKSLVVGELMETVVRPSFSTSKGQGPSAILLHFEDVHVPRCRLLAMTYFQIPFRKRIIDPTPWRQWFDRLFGSHRGGREIISMAVALIQTIGVASLRNLAPTFGPFALVSSPSMRPLLDAKSKLVTNRPSPNSKSSTFPSLFMIKGKTI